MSMAKTIFTDGINKINFLNGMVRLSIGTLVNNDAENNKEPEFNEDYTLIIPLNSFLAGFQSQQQLLTQLEENNIISKQPASKLDKDTGMSVDNVIIP